ncbi:MAG TPA: aldo/keto reductase [Spirochaetia bacterium]|nr:aldo/keto reductase [Spirochaetia bacterium]
MQYRDFGKTGRKVSILGFGAMRLPERKDGTCDIEQSVPILRRGIDLGINYIDSAHVYIKGTSEIAVGEAIKGHERENLSIATKIPVGEEQIATAESWRTRLEESLRRLDTPYIDFIFFHSLKWQAFRQWVSRPGMALQEARKAQDEGLVRHLCFSSHDTPENIINLINTREFAAMLVQYNFLERTNEKAIARASAAGMGVAVMGPLAGGRLAVPRGVALDEEEHLTLEIPRLALRFVWNNPGVAVALSGMSETAQVEANTQEADAFGELTEDEVAVVRRLMEKNRRLSELYCTGCGYCLPCPNQVNIPENFRYMNWYRVWGLEDKAKEAYAKLGGERNWSPWAGVIEGLKAEECVECGECIPKCPQNIPIIEQLKEVARMLST